MYAEREDCFYYLTAQNEMYTMPAMPEGVRDGICRGIYKLAPAEAPEEWPHVHLFGSGAILREAVEAQQMLAERNVAADIWSVTSYSELRRDALAAARWNMLHPSESPRVPYITQVLRTEPWPVVAATDYMKIVPDQIAPFVPNPFYALGTDGFGRSDTRAALRRFFEVDAACITLAALWQLARREQLPLSTVQRAVEELGIDAEKVDPAIA
jgi:pyruvate dehydrogenase E1 component